MPSRAIEATTYVYKVDARCLKELECFWIQLPRGTLRRPLCDEVCFHPFSAVNAFGLQRTRGGAARTSIPGGVGRYQRLQQFSMKECDGGLSMQ